MKDVEEGDSVTKVTNNVKEVFAATATKRLARLKAALACPEPCMFQACMNSCRHNMDHAHTEHFCKDHARTPKSKSYRQQTYAEWNLPEQDSDPDNRLRLLQEELSQRVSELRKQNSSKQPMAVEQEQTQHKPKKTKEEVNVSESEMPPLEASSSDSGGEQPYGGQ